MGQVIRKKLNRHTSVKPVDPHNTSSVSSDNGHLRTKPASQADDRVNNLTMTNTKEELLLGVSKQCKVLYVHDGCTLTIGFIHGGEPIHMKCRCSGYTCQDLSSSNVSEKIKAEQAKLFVAKLLTDKVVPVLFGPFDECGRLTITITPDQGSTETLCTRMCRLGLGQAIN